MTQHTHDSHNHFIVPVKYYVRVFVALLVLTVVTVAVSRIDFGSFNIVVAMGVAMLKASLVAMFFMGLKWEKKLYTVFFVSCILFLGIFLGYVVLDINYRADTDPVETLQHSLKSPVKITK